MRLDHVAVLVEDIKSVVEAWKLPGAQSIEDFPQEGTRELYCGATSRSGRVLLMQPIGPGPYQRAMAKRGPGLHHVALSVDDLIGFVSSVEDSGWLLHPKSLDSYEKNRQAWLCRPGVPCLVELNEASPTYAGAYAQEVSLSVSDALAPLIESLGCDGLFPTQEPRHSFVIEGRRIWIAEDGDS